MTRGRSRSHPPSNSSAPDSRAPDSSSPDSCPAQAAQQRLANDGNGALRCVHCEYEAGIVVMHGTVTSFYHKQLAQEIVRRVVGLGKFDNQLEVSPLR